MILQLKWESFYYNLKRDFKLFIFVWLYLNLLRVIGIWKIQNGKVFLKWQN